MRNLSINTYAAPALLKSVITFSPAETLYYGSPGIYRYAE